MTNATRSKQRDERQRNVEREADRRRKHRRDLTLGIVGVVVIVFFATILLSRGGSSDTPPSAAGAVTIARTSGALLGVGDTVPSFSAPALGGGSIRWSDYTGTPTVLAIWAPWCPHCQAELPRLSQAMAAHPDLQLVTVATAIGQEPGPSVAGYLSDHGLTFPVGIDDAGTTVMLGLGVSSFPTLLYVGADGKVVQVTTGELAASQLDAALTNLGSA